jgi:anti-sigma regulatory factor (Ser/Thr protein kinase)
MARLCRMRGKRLMGRAFCAPLGGRTAVTNASMPPMLLSVMRKGLPPVASNEAVAYNPAQRQAETWPLISHLELAALPTAVSCARRHAKAVVLECGLPALADTIELIVSEIVTNAVRATPPSRSDSLTTPVVRLWLASDLHCVLIRVWDASSQMPARQDPSFEDESGRGLMLVDCLASEWGVDPKQNGKVVWVIVK